MPNPPSEQVQRELVQQAMKGNAEAFGQLYDLLANRVFRSIRYRVDNSRDAEDITQEVFLRAWRSLPKFRLDSSKPFLAWLYVIANNLVVDYQRGSKHERNRDLPTIEVEADSRWQRKPQHLGRAIDLSSALIQLSPLEQQVISLHLIEGLAYAEISPLLSKPAATLRVIQYRALCKLAKMMQGGEANE